MDKWLVILTTPASMAIGTAQLVQKPFRRDQIGGAETLRKAIVDRMKAGAGIRGAALIAQQAGEACRGAQLPRQRPSPARLMDRLLEVVLRCFRGAGRAMQQREFTFEA